MKIILTGTTGYVGEGVMTEVAHSMLTCTRDGYPQFAINPRDITKLAEQN